jgi:hypothetical protein
MIMLFDEVKCPICGDPYSRVQGGTDRVYDICYNCRQDFGATTGKQVADVLDWVKEMTPEEHKGLAKIKDERRKPQHMGFTGQERMQHMVVRKPVDPEKVNMGIRAQTAYGLLTPLTEPLTLPVNYVIAANGLFEVRHTDIADIVIPLSPADTKIIGLSEKLVPGVHPRLPKVPFEMLAQTVAFFRGVMKRFNNAEAIVRIWWNVAEQRYEIRVPDGGQRVSGGGVSHNDDFDLAGTRDAAGNLTFLHVMDIHSHNNMSGFWSGIDDADEKKAPEGRMFGVLGKVPQTIPDWKWRMRSREGFIELTVVDIFAVPEMDLKYDQKVKLASLIVQPTTTVTLTCSYDPFETATCPEDWYKTVNQPTQGQGWHMPWRGHSDGGTRHHALVPSFIFVQREGMLEEFLVEGAKLTATGIKFAITDGRVQDKEIADGK